MAIHFSGRPTCPGRWVRNSAPSTRTDSLGTLPPAADFSTVVDYPNSSTKRPAGELPERELRPAD